jgi:hypothetical protein
VIYILILLLLTVLIWVVLYRAQFLEYDLNFGQLMMAFLISGGLCILGIVLLLRKIKIVRANLVITLVFLLVNSPPVIIVVAMNYEEIFDIPLKVG